MYTQYNSPIGTLWLCFDGPALTGLHLPEEAENMNPGENTGDLPACVKRWLDCYFAGEAVPVDFPLAPEGTAFQKQVWQILLTIPYGETCTYGAIAALLSPQMSARAVGQAVGKNPVSIIIPCHRCLGAGGKLTGYAGGLEMKKWLLTHEGCSYVD